MGNVKGLRNHLVGPCQGIRGESIKCLSKISRLIFKLKILYDPQKLCVQMALGKKKSFPLLRGFASSLISFCRISIISEGRAMVWGRKKHSALQLNSYDTLDMLLNLSSQLHLLAQ